MRALLARMRALEVLINQLQARVAAYEVRLLAAEQALRALRGS